MLVFVGLMWYTQFDFGLSRGLYVRIRPKQKEVFIERVDIAFLSCMTGLDRRKVSHYLAEPRAGKSMWRKKGNIEPLFLIALEKAVLA